MQQGSREKTRQVWVLALASLVSFMVGLDALVVTTALSTIRWDLGVSIEALEWTVNAYTLSFAVLLITAAALGDRFGRRRMFVVGLLLFTGASAACALARNISWLIAARAIQGSGAAFVLPLALTLLSTAFPPEQRARALGIFGSINGLAWYCPAGKSERLRQGAVRLPVCWNTPCESHIPKSAQGFSVLVLEMRLSSHSCLEKSR
jgi:MFS family permease